MIVIGIDPHKASVTAAALSSDSAPLGHRRLATTAKTGAHLISWAAEWPDRLWAVEGAAGLGHGIAQQLVAAGERVVDVPAKLAARARLLGSGSARETDLTDAVSVASVAIHNPKLSVVEAEDHTVVLRLLSDRRDDLVSQRTRTMNRLQVLLRNLEPGGAPRQLSTAAAAAFLARVRPITLADQQRKSIARDLLDDLRRADRQLAAMGNTIATEVAGSGTTCRRSTASGRSWRPRSSAMPASSTASSPRATSPATPGRPPSRPPAVTSAANRLNRAGNRQLNTALHAAAVVQAGDANPGRDHYERKIAELKTPKEAQRSLKRQLANVVYRHLLDDHERHHQKAAS